MINIPTISNLFAGIISNVQTALNITIPNYGKNFLNAFSGVQAATLKLFYLGLSDVQKNIWPDTADPAANGGTLERFGLIKLGRPPQLATQGYYTATITGSIGAIVPAQTTFKSDDTSTSPGYLFIVDNEFVLTGTTDTIPLRALTGGNIAFLNLGDTLTVTAPIALVDAAATINAITTNPSDAETIEHYRDAIIKSFQLQPEGGAAVDYRLWAQDEPTVQNSYPYADSGEACTINVFVEAVASDSTDGKGTPNGTTLANVAEYIEMKPDPQNIYTPAQRGRRPLGVFQVNVLPITVKTVDVNIHGFAPALTTPQQTLLKTNIKNAINLVRPFVAAIDPTSSKNNYIDSNFIVGVVLQTFPGSVFGAITIKVDSIVVSNYTFLNGDIPYPNDPTFI